jgi:hypothetical protein
MAPVPIGFVCTTPFVPRTLLQRANWLCFAHSAHQGPDRPATLGLFRTIAPTELGLFVQPASGPAARRGVPVQGCPESAIGELGLFGTIGLLDLPSPRCLSLPRFGFV